MPANRKARRAAQFSQKPLVQCQWMPWPKPPSWRRAVFLRTFRWGIKIRYFAEKSITGAPHGPRWGAAGAGFGVGMTCIVALIQSGHSLERLSVVLLALLASCSFSSTCFSANWIRLSLSVGIILRSLVILAVIWGGAVWLGIKVWPPIHRHHLSAKERELFLRPLLGAQVPPMRIQVACPAVDERTCAYAAQFQALFSEANWDVDGTVQRVTLMRPTAGVTLVEKGGTKESQTDKWKWNIGGWTNLSASYENVYQAFSNLGIEGGGSAGSDVPDNQIIVYFGPERDDESQPTELSITIANLRRQRSEGLVPYPGQKPTPEMIEKSRRQTK